MKYILLLLVALTVSSCNKRSVGVEVQTNSDIKLELLFEKDGCKMYRFYDGRYIYWSTCPGKTESLHRASKTSHMIEVITDTISDVTYRVKPQ